LPKPLEKSKDLRTKQQQFVTYLHCDSSGTRELKARSSKKGKANGQTIASKANAKL